MASSPAFAVKSVEILVSPAIYVNIPGAENKCADNMRTFSPEKVQMVLNSGHDGILQGHWKKSFEHAFNGRAIKVSLQLDVRQEANGTIQVGLAADHLQDNSRVLQQILVFKPGETISISGNPTIWASVAGGRCPGRIGVQLEGLKSIN